MSSILKREEVELPGLHGAVNETTRTSRRSGRVRPRIRLKTEQKSLAETDRIHLEKTLYEAAWQGETITQLKRRELFLTREASNLESEVIGLKENMKTVLEDNLNLKTELLRWRSQREAESKHVDTNFRPDEKRRLDLLEVQVNEYKERSSAHASQLEEKNK